MQPAMLHYMYRYPRPPPKFTSQFYTDLNQILSHLALTLKCFTFEDKTTVAQRHGGPSVMSMSASGRSDFDSSNGWKGTLNIPEHVEWLKFIHSCSYSGFVDISKCKKLICFSTCTEIFGNIVYPQAYVIPFLYLKDGNKHWFTFNKPDVRFIASTGMEGNDGIRINEIALKLKNIHDNTDTSLLCMELHKDEFSDKDELFFYKLMRYYYQDEKIRNEKIVECKRWWEFRSGLWFKNPSKSQYDWSYDL